MRGETISWITPSSRWNTLLIEGGARLDLLLDLSQVEDRWEEGGSLAPEGRDYLSTIERAAGVSINEMILMDRALREMPHDKARRYLLAVARAVETFLTATRPDVVLGEATWGWEILTGAIARKLGIRQYGLSTARFPSERVAFWDGHRDETVFPLRHAEPEDRQDAERLVDAFRLKPKKPLYEVSNAKLPLVRRHWIDEALALISSAERRNPAARSLPARVVSRGRMLINTLRQRLHPAFEEVPPEPRAPFVLCLLHVQPEASIDVLGSYHRDQVDNIEALARSLPSTHDIYVKEHPSAVGDRSPDYYRRLKRIPQVRLIPPGADTFSLIREAWLVFAVTGTACYEAGLLGVPAVTAAPLLFADVTVDARFTPKAETLVSLQEKVAAYRAQSPETHRQRAIDMVAHILRCSFPAIVSDPASDPRCMEPENLKRLADGIGALYRYRPTA